MSRSTVGYFCKARWETFRIYEKHTWVPLQSWMANRNGKLLNDICLSKNYSPKSNIPHICGWVWPRCWILGPSDELRGLWLWTPRLRPPLLGHPPSTETRCAQRLESLYPTSTESSYGKWLIRFDQGRILIPMISVISSYQLHISSGWHTAFMTIIPSPSGCCSCGSALPKSVGVRTAAPNCRYGCRRPGQHQSSNYVIRYVLLEEITLRLPQFSEVILWYQGVWIWEKKEMKWKIQHQMNSSDDISGFIP